MIICVKCRTRMKCVKNGASVLFNFGWKYEGDRWKCPHCSNEIIVTAQQGYAISPDCALEEYDIKIEKT